MDLIAHALESEERRPAGVFQFDRAAVEEAAVDVRQRGVAGAARDRECLHFVPGIDAEFVLHPGGAELSDHILPISGNGVFDRNSPEFRNVHAFPGIRLIRHLPISVERNLLANYMFKLLLELFRGSEKRGTRRQGGKKQSCHLCDTLILYGKFCLFYKTFRSIVKRRWNIPTFK